MATVTINNSPVHGDSILTAVFGETGSSWARYHTGTDFAPYGLTPTNPDLYSVCDGTVYSKTFDGTLGNQIIIEDTNTGNFWRYCHMQNASPLNVGDNVTTSTKVGVMGATRKCYRDTLTPRICNFPCMELLNIFKSKYAV